MELSSNTKIAFSLLVLFYSAIVGRTIASNDDGSKEKEIWTPCIWPMSTTHHLDNRVNLTSCRNVFQVIQMVCVQLMGSSSVLEITTTSPTASLITSLITLMSNQTTRPNLNELKAIVSMKRIGWQCKQANHAALQGLQTLLTHWHRYKVLVLIDYSIDLSSQSIVNILQVHEIQCSVHYLDQISKDEIATKVQGWSHVAVLANEDNMSKLIIIANRLRLFSKEFVSWIFVTTNRSMGMWSTIDRPLSQINLLLTHDNPAVTKLPEWFSFHFNHGPLTDNPKLMKHLPSECDSIKREVKMIKIRLTDQSSDEIATTSQMDLYDVFHSQQSDRTEVLPIATWKPRTGLQFYTNWKDIDAQQHLRGRQMKIITFEEQPYLFINKGRDGLQMTGYLYELLTILTQHLNMEPKIELSPTAATGIAIGPGNYSGVVGILFRREADLAMVALGMTVTRRPAIRFSSPIITQMYLSIFLRTPPLGISYTDYIDVFSQRLWICVIVSLALAMAAILAVAYFRPIVITNYDTLSDTPMKTVVSGVKRRLYWVFSGMFYEEVMTFTRGRASKIVVGVFLFSTVVISAYYTTALTSFLIIQVIKLPFENMEELVNEHSNYRIVLVTGTNHFDHFRNSNEGLYAKVWKMVNDKRKLQDVVSDVQEGLDKAYKNNYVLFGDGPSAKYISRDNHSITFLDVNYFYEFSHFPIRMDFPYYKIVSITLQRLHENGVLDVLSKRYFPFLKKVKSRATETNTLGLYQVVTPFMVLAVGLITSLCVLVLEVVFHFNW